MKHRLIKHWAQAGGFSNNNTVKYKLINYLAL